VLLTAHVLMFFFLLYRSGLHRALHSFPTRRSSDLSKVSGSAERRDTARTTTATAADPASASSACCPGAKNPAVVPAATANPAPRSEEHTSELQSRFDLVCRLLLEKKNTKQINND